jgi:hypothetical protein
VHRHLAVIVFAVGHLYPGSLGVSELDEVFLDWAGGEDRWAPLGENLALIGNY